MGTATRVAYTYALGGGANSPTATLAKILAISLQRCNFDGLIVILKDFEEPLFKLPRPNLVEQCFVRSPITNESVVRALRDRSALLDIIKELDVETCTFFHPASIVLRNPEILLDLPANSDVLHQICGRASKGDSRQVEFEYRWDISPIFSFSAALANAVLDRVNSEVSPENILDGLGFRLDSTDTTIGLSGDNRIRHPLQTGVNPFCYDDFPALHFGGMDPALAVRFSWGIYLSYFYFNDPTLLINIFES